MRAKGFTIIELLVYMAIFTVVIIAFIAIFVVIVRIQNNQSSAIEVDSQSQYLLQQIQYYVEASSLIDMPQDTPTTTLVLRMANPLQDPTYIMLEGGDIYLQQSATGTVQQLNSNQVTISNLTFTKHSNPPSHDSVSVSMTVAYNSSNLQQAFSQALQTSIARVSASTFDSNLTPSTTNAWSLGTPANSWNNINGVIQFSGGDVGVGSDMPEQQLDVAGGIRIYTAGLTQPSCSSSNAEGTLWFIQKAPSASDTLQLCVDGTGGYQWAKLY
jgi:type II secretory pathway component PulJ